MGLIRSLFLKETFKLTDAAFIENSIIMKYVLQIHFLNINIHFNIFKM